MRRINVGVLGCGAVAELCHLPAIQNIPEIKIKALADVNKERALELVGKFNLKEASTYTDYHTLLERPDIEAVLVLTPPHLHAQMTIDAAKSGKHILCEKPLATTIKESKEIVKAVKSAGIHCMVGFNYRFQPHFIKAKEMVDKGFISPRFVNTYFLTEISSWPTVSRFQFHRKHGGGALFEMGCHHVDLLRWLIGEVSYVQAHVTTLRLDAEVEDTASVYLEFENGVFGSISVSWIAPFMNKIEIVGRDGYLIADVNKKDIKLKLKGKTIFKEGPIRISVERKKRSYNQELLHFIQCISKNRKPSVTAEDGLKALKIITAAYKSARMKRKMAI